MLNLPQYLISQGWQCSRRVYESGQWVNKPSDFENTYSTMGHIDYRFKKDSKEVIYGLSEKSKPPTLIYPRPFQTDDQVNRWLQNTPIEEVYKFILDVHKIDYSKSSIGNYP